MSAKHIVKVIDSCTNIEQIEVCNFWLSNIGKKDLYELQMIQRVNELARNRNIGEF